MLVQLSGSSSCRGWEGNSSELIETDCKSLIEYIHNHIKDDYDIETKEELEEFLKDNKEWGISEEECSFEGEEGTETYKKFQPTQEYVDLLLRNL